MRLPTRLLAVAGLVAGSFVAISPAAYSAGLTNHCGYLNQQVLQPYYPTVGVPTSTPYNYAAGAKNLTHAIGTTVDYGTGFPVISCVSPDDLTKIGAKLRKTFTASSYVTYLTTSLGRPFKKTFVVGTWDYVAGSTGAASGVGSLAKAASIRLDLFDVSNKYVLLIQTSPGTTAITPIAVRNLIHALQNVL
jgi:hypothetical protein